MRGEWQREYLKVIPLSRGQHQRIALEREDINMKATHSSVRNGDVVALENYPRKPMEIKNRTADGLTLYISQDPVRTGQRLFSAESFDAMNYHII